MRCESAHGSARDVSACIEVAVALGYREALEAPVAARLRHVTGALGKLAS